MSDTRKYLVTYRKQEDGKYVALTNVQVPVDSAVVSMARVEEELIEGMIEDRSPNEMLQRIFR